MTLEWPIAKDCPGFAFNSPAVPRYRGGGVQEDPEASRTH